MTNRLSPTLSAIVFLAFAGCAATPEQAPQQPAPTPAPAAPAAAPAPAPAPAPKAVSEKHTVNAVPLFDFDRAVIRPDARTQLDDLVTKMRGANLEVVIAIGHADRIGSDAYNMKLSLRRADSVKAYLVGKGVPANRVYTEGKGETQPVKECKGEKKTKALIACLQPNRRVEAEAVGTQTR